MASSWGYKPGSLQSNRVSSQQPIQQQQMNNRRQRQRTAEIPSHYSMSTFDPADSCLNGTFTAASLVACWLTVRPDMVDSGAFLDPALTPLWRLDSLWATTTLASLDTVFPADALPKFIIMIWRVHVGLQQRRAGVMFLRQSQICTARRDTNFVPANSKSSNWCVSMCVHARFGGQKQMSVRGENIATRTCTKVV